MANTKNSKTAGETNAEATDSTPVIAVNGVEPNTDAATTSAAPDEAQDVPKMADLNGIRYVGVADRKILKKQDLESLGAVDPKGHLTWDAGNNKTIRSDEINASTRDVLLALPDFVAS